MRSAQFSDNDLLRGLVSRDERILREYYKLYFERIRRLVIRNSGNDDDAKDLFQDALLVLFQKTRKDGFILKSALGTYLYSVSRLLWLKELRKRKMIMPFVDNADHIIDEDSDTALISDKNERLFFYRKCFEKLSEDCRKILTLFSNGISIAEITVIMGYGSDQYTRNRRCRCKLSLINSIKAQYEEKRDCDGNNTAH